MATNQRIAIDLNPNPVEARPQLDPKHRIFYLAAFAVIVVLGLFSFFNWSGTNRANKQADEAEAQTTANDNKAKELMGVIKQANLNRARAENMGRWVTTTLNTQPFIIVALQDISKDSKDVTVQSFNLKLTEGQAQIESVELTLLGDIKLINQHLDAMTSRLQQAGLQLVSPDPVPIAGGLRFKGRFIFPPANRIGWK